MDIIRLEIADAAAAPKDAVENALRIVPGVMSVRADPAGHGVHVEVTDTITADDLIVALGKAGYIATLSG
jgi:copper chaperone CopZ